MAPETIRLALVTLYRIAALELPAGQRQAALAALSTLSDEGAPAQAREAARRAVAPLLERAGELLAECAELHADALADVDMVTQN